MDVLNDFGCMDLLDQSSDICWDPSPLFEDQHHPPLAGAEDDADAEEHVFRQFMLEGEFNNNNNNNSNNEISTNNSCVDLAQSSGGVQNESSSAVADDLAVVFFEWLKSNKETVSAEDLRNIKIKKSTIESAAKRLGGGKEGMKQLLKLILQWVQNHHLHGNPNPNPNPNTNPGGNVNLGSNSNHNQDLNCMNPATWLTPPPTPFGLDMGPMVPVAPGFTPMLGGSYGNGHPYQIPGSEYPSWALPTGPMQYGVGPYGSFPDPGLGGYAAGYPAGFYHHPGGPGEGLVKMGSSATKEARKKRMARQRRFFTHHHRSDRTHQSHHSNSNIQHNPMVEMNGGVGNVNCGVVTPNPAHANWMYWPHHQRPPVLPSITVNPLVPGSGSMVGQVAPSQESVGVSGFPRQVGGGVEKKQGWKTEKNLRFILHKVLKQSDVGNLGRIVLPKKEAEMHLPELEARDGILIAMEDIRTSRVWNMRYRFWPNNKSRMYLLENTGDFVRSNGLQQGDFIVIYSDVKCGKYMIRGVKVRPQQGAKKLD